MRPRDVRLDKFLQVENSGDRAAASSVRNFGMPASTAEIMPPSASTCFSR
jgi:hypothetical protein